MPAPYATRGQGMKADTALQPGDLLAGNFGSISASQVSGLGSAATTNASSYATASQGALASTALQPNGDGSQLTGITASQISGLPVENAFAHVMDQGVAMADSPAFSALTVGGMGIQGGGAPVTGWIMAYDSTLGAMVPQDPATLGFVEGFPTPSVIGTGVLYIGAGGTLGTAAYTNSTAYATAAQGALAATALQSLPQPLGTTDSPTFAGLNAGNSSFYDCTMHSLIINSNIFLNNDGTIETNTNGYFLGSVGIGNSTPTRKLDVSGDASFDGDVRAASFTGDGSGLTGISSGTSYDQSLNTTDSVTFAGLTITGTAWIGTAEFDSGGNINLHSGGGFSTNSGPSASAILNPTGLFFWNGVATSASISVADGSASFVSGLVTISALGSVISNGGFEAYSGSITCGGPSGCALDSAGSATFSGGKITFTGSNGAASFANNLCTIASDGTITAPNINIGGLYPSFSQYVTLSGVETLTNKTVNGVVLAGSGTLTIGSGGTLGTAAYTASTAYATAAQGTLAGTALQPTGNGSGLTGITAGQISGLPSANATIDFVIDGAGDTIITGSKGYLEITTAMTINGWTLMADQSGSIVVDVKKSTYSGFPTNSSIAGGTLPTLSSAQKNQNLSLSGWITTVSVGDILEYVVNSITNCQRVTLSLRGTKT